MAIAAASALGVAVVAAVALAQGEVSPQTTLLPAMVVSPQTTLSPHTTLVPERTVAPQTTLVANIELSPHTTLAAPVELRFRVVVFSNLLKVTDGDAAEPTDFAVLKKAALISIIPAPTVNISCVVL